jgi:hypothetical protein
MRFHDLEILRRCTIRIAEQKFGSTVALRRNTGCLESISILGSSSYKIYVQRRGVVGRKDVE